MSHVFKKQTLLTLTVETGYLDLGSAEVVLLKYKKPTGVTGSFTPTVSGTSLVYQFQAGDIDKAGSWLFQAYIEIGGLKANGDIFTHHFATPLIDS